MLHASHHSENMCKCAPSPLNHMNLELLSSWVCKKWFESSISVLTSNYVVSYRQYFQNQLPYASDLSIYLSSTWILLFELGLHIEVDRILEIACVITDGNLAKSIEGPDLVIHQTKDCLDKMGQWCQSHHAASGLTEKVLQSTISEQEAEKQVVEFVRRNVGAHTPLLAGNSVYVDLLFLKKYMPDLASLFSHVLVDVSSIKALCIRWYPRDNKKARQKENKHRAMDDIKESIAELKYYKENIFKAKSKK
ncbi:unnamed protein product [Ilex paraguariensis]|uniref:Exonuclease domain-containing protein n=1 Tax=Ilex paraguariensis TaxID=185542 RepID=A0ABC8QRN9_9AQUA